MQGRGWVHHGIPTSNDLLEVMTLATSPNDVVTGSGGVVEVGKGAKGAAAGPDGRMLDRRAVAMLQGL